MTASINNPQKTKAILTRDGFLLTVQLACYEGVPQLTESSTPSGVGLAETVIG